jgi:transposase InsO family protein
LCDFEQSSHATPRSVALRQPYGDVSKHHFGVLKAAGREGEIRSPARLSTREIDARRRPRWVHRLFHGGPCQPDPPVRADEVPRRRSQDFLSLLCGAARELHRGPPHFPKFFTPQSYAKTNERKGNSTFAFSGYHTNRGSQYCAHAYQNLVSQFGMQASMSRRGNCSDNASLIHFGAS